MQIIRFIILYTYPSTIIISYFYRYSFILIYLFIFTLFFNLRYKILVQQPFSDLLSRIDNKMGSIIKEHNMNQKGIFRHWINIFEYKKMISDHKFTIILRAWLK